MITYFLFGALLLSLASALALIQAYRNAPLGRQDENGFTASRIGLVQANPSEAAHGLHPEHSHRPA